LCGWQEAEARGKTLSEVFRILNEETRQPVPNPAEGALRECRVITLANHTILVSRDGREFPIEDSGAPIYDTDKKICGSVLVFRDKSADVAAERERALLEYAIRSSVNEIYLFDADTLRFRFVNEGALRNLGFTLDQMRTMTPLDIKPTHTPESFARLVEPLLRREVPVIRFETEHQRANGSRYPVEIHLQLFEHQHRRVFLAVIQDLTERRNMEGQLHQAQKMESVGNLAGGVAHDFNNMLGVIIGRAEVAQQRLPADNPVQSDLQEILQSAHRSADLTRQLLAFARKQTASPRVIDLNEVIDGMLRMLRRLIGENISLRWQPGASLWPIRIDPAQIDQILANLVVNARDAIRNVGTISLETENIAFDAEYVQAHPEFVQGDFVRLSVSDTGSGMTKEVMARVFEPFFTTKELGKGTGLGLAMVYGIVKQNDGFINVYSEPGRGTTFNLYFGRSRETVQTPAQPVTLPSATGHETILLVEDEPSLLELGTMLLTRLGYRVLTVGSPQEALERVSTNSESIDLLITDVVMPEMNGRDLAEAIRKIRPGIRVLFMSGYTADVIAHHGVIEAGKAFLQKPFNRSQLANTVRQVLDAPLS